MEPAANIVAKLGGPTEVARLLKIHRTRVSNWMRPKEKGGTGGTVPQKYHRTILAESERGGLQITADDLLPALAEEGTAA